MKKCAECNYDIEDENECITMDTPEHYNWTPLHFHLNCALHFTRTMLRYIGSAVDRMRREV